MEVDNQYRPGPWMGRMQLAHAYVPFQEFSEAYPSEVALRKGTLFPELWMPYRPGRGKGYY